MSTQQYTPRPWYCHDRLTDEYITVHDSDGDLQMIKSLKIIRSIIVNIGIITIGLYALRQGADPSIIGGTALLILGAYNGVEVLDYVSLAQAILETNSNDSSDGGGG